MASVRASKAVTATKLASQLLVLCTLRSGEVRLARWDEVDLGNAVWENPAERMKAKRAHRIPLSARAIGILRDEQTPVAAATALAALRREEKKCKKID